MIITSYIYRYCLLCKHHEPDENSGMDVYCGKEKMLVRAYTIQKCRSKKYYVKRPEGT
jgi:hypothetical protein